MAKKCPKLECPAGEKWAVPYADFLSLLLALFIALYALAAVNIEKQRALKEEFVKIYNYTANDSEVEPSNEMTEKATAEDANDAPDAGKKIMKHTLDEPSSASQHKSGGLLELPGGSLMSVPAHLVFESGKAEVTSVFASDFLARLSELIKAMPKETEINVKGYAEENEVRGSKYKDALELSTSRANNVIRELIKLNIEPSRLYSSGFGSSKTTTLKDKRVVLFELHSSTDILNEEEDDIETIFNKMK